MTRCLPIFVKLILMLFAFETASANAENISCEYTLDEVMSAYEAGQFRVIPTNSTFPAVSADGTHILALGEGLYRLSDGMFFDQFNLDWGFFSDDGQYLAQPSQGIYRVSDLELLVPARRERISVANGEHRIFTGTITFSSNSEYVSINGAGWYREQADSQSQEGYGVFRLSDGEQIIHSDSYVMEFSSDSNYFATTEGVFRLIDGQKIIETDDYIPTFSPDSAYVTTRENTLRLSDGAVIFSSQGSVYFTPDMAYAVAPSDGVYRLSDGQKLYALDHYPVYAHPPHFSANSQYVAIPSSALSSDALDRTFIYRIADGSLLFEFDGFSNYDFSPAGDLIGIGKDGVYRLDNLQKLVSIQGEADLWNMFSADGAYVVSGSDGIYRIADGAKLFDIESQWITIDFSPDSQYVAISEDGLYRLADQQKLFTIPYIRPNFSLDGHFISARDLENIRKIYRVSDGHLFDDVLLLKPACGILMQGSKIVIVEPG